MDKGEKAIIATLDFWDRFSQVTVLGINRSEEAKSKPVLKEINNIKTGFLSYTYGTKAIPVPADKTYLVSLINKENMAREIDTLRPLCDVLVVSMHWGEEYSHTQSKEQEELAVFLAEHNVDIVLGHHPHVIQPVEYIQRPDGRFMLCYYSLGNLISAQTQVPAMLGALAYIKLKKEPAQPENIGQNFMFIDAGAISTVTHYEKNYTGFMVYPLYNYTKELAEKHFKNEGKKELTLKLLANIAEKILKEKEIKDPIP
jgi:poly-gamma-glutamate synthesis protein (capsule biosynthesis protein)